LFILPDASALLNGRWRVQLDLWALFDYYFELNQMKAIISLLAGWLVPGLGHAVQRKFGRAVVFFVSVGAMTAMGLAMSGRIYGPQTENPLTILAFFADVGNLLVFLLSRFLAFGQGALERASFEFGTAYIAGAGLLNYLIALDACDLARGKKK
jgi:hypothetical protein